MVFHDRRLQYTEHQQLEGWKWNRPGDRLLDIGNGAWHKILPIPLIMCVCGGGAASVIIKTRQSDVFHKSRIK